MKAIVLSALIGPHAVTALWVYTFAPDMGLGAFAALVGVTLFAQWAVFKVSVALGVAAGVALGKEAARGAFIDFVKTHDVKQKGTA
jgi:hypothetical protein